MSYYNNFFYYSVPTHYCYCGHQLAVEQMQGVHVVAISIYWHTFQTRERLATPLSLLLLSMYMKILSLPSLNRVILLLTNTDHPHETTDPSVIDWAASISSRHSPDNIISRYYYMFPPRGLPYQHCWGTLELQTHEIEDGTDLVLSNVDPPQMSVDGG